MNWFKIVITLMKKRTLKISYSTEVYIISLEFSIGFVSFSNWTEQTFFLNNNSQKDDIKN